MLSLEVTKVASLRVFVEFKVATLYASKGVFDDCT